VASEELSQGLSFVNVGQPWLPWLPTRRSHLTGLEDLIIRLIESFQRFFVCPLCNYLECEDNNPGRSWLEVEGRFGCFGFSYRNGWREALWEAGIYENIVADGIERLSVL
jgi:hypothetical protein